MHRAARARLKAAVHLGSICGWSDIQLGLIRSPSGIGQGSIWGRYAVIWGPLGVHLGSINGPSWADLGPICFVFTEMATMTKHNLNKHRRANLNAPT